MRGKCRELLGNKHHGIFLGRETKIKAAVCEISAVPIINVQITMRSVHLLGRLQTWITQELPVRFAFKISIYILIDTGFTFLQSYLFRCSFRRLQVIVNSAPWNDRHKHLKLAKWIPLSELSDYKRIGSVWKFLFVIVLRTKQQAALSFTCVGMLVEVKCSWPGAILKKI